MKLIPCKEKLSLAELHIVCVPDSPTAQGMKILCMRWEATEHSLALCHHPAWDLHSVSPPNDQIQRAYPHFPPLKGPVWRPQHLPKMQIHQWSWGPLYLQWINNVVLECSFHCFFESMWFQNNQWKNEKFIFTQLVRLLFEITLFGLKLFLIEWANILKEHLNRLYCYSMGMAEHYIKVYFHLTISVFITQNRAKLRLCHETFLYYSIKVMSDFSLLKNCVFILSSKLSVFLIHIFFYICIIYGAYYLGEFNGSKMCSLTIQKEEVLYSVSLWWVESFR